MSPSRPRGPRAWAVDFVLLAAIWGGSFLFIRLGVAEFGPLPAAAMRVAIASAVMLPVVLWRGLGRELLRHAPRVMAVGVVNSALPFALYSYALTSISTGLSAVLNATVPLFGALVAWLWLGDRPQASRALGLAIGFTGVGLLAWSKSSFQAAPGQLASGWAVLLCVAATLCYGIGASATRKYLRGLPPLVNATGSQVGALLCLCIPAALQWPARLPGPTAWFAVAALGVLCTGVAYVLYFRLIEEAGPSRALAVTFVVPVFAVLYGVVLLGEAVTAAMLGCGSVIVLGTGLATGLLQVRRRAIAR